jgi:hypothetical protein
MSLLCLLAVAAHADDIVFTDLAISADQGITLRYALSPTTAQRIAEGSNMGAYPRISVQVVSGGMNKTSHVELKEPSRTVTLDSGSWPPGLTATVKLEAGVRDLDRLRAPQGSGTSLRVGVDGGTAGATPLGMPSQQSQTATRSTQSSRVSGSPAPSGGGGAPAVQVDPAALLAAAQAAAQHAADAQRIAEQQQRIAEEQQRIAEERARVRAWLQGIFDDPGHPVHAACAAGLTGGHFEDCVNVAAFRDDGAAEVDACLELDEPAFRIQCFESLEKRAYGARGALEACVEVFGTGEDGLRCTNAVIESVGDPTGDIRACGAGFEARDDRLWCIGRFRELSGDATGVIEACASSFQGDQARECLGIAGEAGPGGDAIGVCAETFEPKVALECVRALRPVVQGSAAALVPACAALFEAPKDQLQCLERARRDPDPERIAACSAEAGKRRLRCVEGG